MDFKIIEKFWRTYFFFFLTTVNPEAGLRVQCVVGYVIDLKKKKPQKNNLLTVIPGTSS